MRSYEINPRPVEVGGGWNVKIFQDGDEFAGGAFPISEEDPTDDDAYAAALAFAEELTYSPAED